MSTTTQTHMTAEQIMYLQDELNRHELIKGELLTMSPTGFPHARTTMNLAVLLTLYLRDNNLGVAVPELGFILERNPDTVLAPDIAFIAHERLGTTPPGFFVGPPDLAVEVQSPSDSKPGVDRKTALWLELGARVVWNVDPQKRTVEVCRPGGEKKLFYETDELVDDVVPGFRVKVSEIFA